MYKPTYTKLIQDAGKLVAVAADYEGRHELVRVDHPLLANPLVVAAYMTPKDLVWKSAIAAAAKFVIYGRAMRAPDPVEAFIICDRSQYPALPKLYFPDADKHFWTWTDTVDAEDPASDAWFVGLDSGSSSRFLQSNQDRVRAVCAGQFSELGVAA
jgi:hypothetical protein